MALSVLAALAFATGASGQSADALIQKLIQKGVLTEQEGKDLLTESTTTNLANKSKWKIGDAVKNIELFGDLRFRYEYRGIDNPQNLTGVTNNHTYYRERFRYAARFGLHGDMFDDFYFGLRLETSSNPRSPWVTFGDDTTGTGSLNTTPFAKNSDGLAIGQAYVGWRPTDWFEFTVGKMPMPLYTTPMIWDADINPEGAVEKLKVGTKYVDFFANFGQFIYQDANPDLALPSSDTFMLAWQMGSEVKFTKDITLKVAPVLYYYTGVGHTNNGTGAIGENQIYNGEGITNANFNNVQYAATGVAQSGIVNQSALNDLMVLEVPAELNFKIGRLKARVFGDFAYNVYGEDRAAAAYASAPRILIDDGTGHLTPVGLTKSYPAENKAYQVGFALGNLGLVYGQTSKKNTWEARAYWQHIEQYAVDVNLIDSDFFEGRANLEGFYTAFAYSFTDAVIGTVRYGYAHPINENLGTGGDNPDLPGFNPINNYHLVQLDLTCRF